jgi:hypothetical protein
MDQERFACECVIQALRNGDVPTRGVDRIAVGRDAELMRFRHELEHSENGTAWVIFLSGDYGAGKTFLCSLLREEAWKAGFVVATVPAEAPPPFHQWDAVYRRIVEGVHTDRFRDIPAFEFIVQEWLLSLERKVQQMTGMDPLNPEHRTAILKTVGAHIDKRLAEANVDNASFAKVLRHYHAAVQQGHDVLAAAASDWLMGKPGGAGELRAQLGIHDDVGPENALDSLRTVVALFTQTGYAGLVVLCDDADRIRMLARPDNRNAAYDNIRLLMEKTAQGELGPCGFVFAGAADWFTDARRGIPSYPPLHERLRVRRGQRKGKDAPSPLIALNGFNKLQLLEVAAKVREVHGIARRWQPARYLTDEQLVRLIEDMGLRQGDPLTRTPRGFLKVLVDILDALADDPHQSATAVIAAQLQANQIEAIEREEALLPDS